MEMTITATHVALFLLIMPVVNSSISLNYLLLQLKQLQANTNLKLWQLMKDFTLKSTILIMVSLPPKISSLTATG